MAGTHVLKLSIPIARTRSPPRHRRYQWGATPQAQLPPGCFSWLLPFLHFCFYYSVIQDQQYIGCSQAAERHGMLTPAIATCHHVWSDHEPPKNIFIFLALDLHLQRAPAHHLTSLLQRGREVEFPSSNPFQASKFLSDPVGPIGFVPASGQVF